MRRLFRGEKEVSARQNYRKEREAIVVKYWAIAAIVFLVIEGVTAGLASIWFAIGALAALVAAALGAPFWLQAVWFAVLSAATLVLTRPLARKYVNSKTVPTNADRIIGTLAVVKEAIDNLAETGAVLAGGKIWTARSADGGPIGAGTTVRIREIQGVKLIVSREV